MKVALDRGSPAWRDDGACSRLYVSATSSGAIKFAASVHAGDDAGIAH